MKNFKRKAALMLALVMLLSMVPANLFGQAIHFGGTNISGNLTGTIVHGWDWASGYPPTLRDPSSELEFQADPITINIPLSAIAGLTSPIQLTFATTNSWAMDRYSRNNNGIENWQFNTVAGGAGAWISQTGVVGRTTVPAIWTSSLPTPPLLADGVTPGPPRTPTDSATDWWGWGASVADITIPAQFLEAGNVASGLQGTLAVTVMVRAFDVNDADHWRNATMSVRAIGASGTLHQVSAQVRQLLQNVPMVAAQAARSITISATGGARSFTSALLVPPIRFAESQHGVLSGNMVLRLTAPEFYRWAYMPRNVGNLASNMQNHLMHGSTGFGRLSVVDTRQMAIYAGGTAFRGASFLSSLNAAGTAGADIFSQPDGDSLRRLPIHRINVGRVSQTGGVHATDRHRVDIHMSNVQRSVGHAGVAEWLEVRNMWLIPDDNAAMRGNVYIDVEIGRPLNVSPVAGEPTWVWVPNENNDGGKWIWQPPAPAVGAVMPVTTSMENSRLGTAQHPVLVAGQVRNSLHVGTRGAADISVTVEGGPAEARTGTLGTFRAANATITNSSTIPTGTRPAFVWNRDNEGLAHFTGVQTATLVIEENAVGAFGYGFGSPINFEFLDADGNQHPGIRILGIEARAGNNQDWGHTRGELNNFYGGPSGVAFAPGYGRQGSNNHIANNNATEAEMRAGQNWMTFRGWVSALDQRLPTVAGVGRVNDTIASIYLPHQNLHDVVAPGMLEVRFWLSLEAGYEWKYGEDVEVTISGAGVTNLVGPSGTYTAVVAHARDPIQMTLATGSTPVETGTLYNIQGNQAISDVIVDVLDNSAFTIGDELWLYIGTDTVGRNFDVNLLNIPTLTVNAESGLRFDTGRLMAPTAGGHVGRAGVVFTVTRQPYGGNAPAPEIIISNIRVEGQAFPGIEYQVILSGTAIADNDQEVFNAVRNRNVAEATVIAAANRGIFTSLPYNRTALENVAGGADRAPEGGTQLVNEFRMWQGMGPIAGVNEPFRWVPLVGTNLRVGFVSARAFAYFINGSPDVGVNWDAATNTATVGGTDVHGNAVSVVMTVGSNIATVNGSPVDIATFAGQSGPAGSIQVVPTPDGRIFLPLRFLANAFGRTVTLEGEVVVFR